MIAAEELSLGATLGWGCLGGVVAYVVVFLLPELRRLYDVGFNRVSMPRVAAAVGIAAVYVFLGGMGALLVGDATSYKHALAYGVACESILAGAIKGIAPKGD